MEEKFIVVRDPIRGSPEFKGPYSNLTLAENDLKEFGDLGGMSMIIKVVGAVNHKYYDIKEIKDIQ